jgi:hypothetical protein
MNRPKPFSEYRIKTINIHYGNMYDVFNFYNLYSKIYLNPKSSPSMFIVTRELEDIHREYDEISFYNIYYTKKGVRRVVYCDDLHSLVDDMEKQYKKTGFVRLSTKNNVFSVIDDSNKIKKNRKYRNYKSYSNKK